MSLKVKAILFSLGAIGVLVLSLIIFREYRLTNARLYKTISTLDMVNHAGQEIAIEILLDVKDYDSLNKYLQQIPSITKEFQSVSFDGGKPSELVDMEMSFVRVKRVVENLTPGQTVQKAVAGQIHNEVKKISEKVGRLKELSELEIKRLQTRSEIMILILYSVLATYVVLMFLLLFNIVIKPILLISSQIEKVGHGELDEVVIPARKDEIGLLTVAFNEMNDRRKQNEKALKQEMAEHLKILKEVKILSGFLPICASCKNIRDDKGYWKQIEQYIQTHSEAQFSHGICPDCVKKLYPELSEQIIDTGQVPPE